MFLDRLFRIRRYYHHQDTHHHHPHSHTHDDGPGITTKKSGTREIKVIRRVLDVNEKIAAENRRMFISQASMEDSS